MNKTENTPTSSKTESSKKTRTPKTSSISKSLLTPCRRVGLSARKKSLQRKGTTPETELSVQQKDLNTKKVQQAIEICQNKLQKPPSVIQEHDEKERKSGKLEKVQKPCNKSKRSKKVKLSEVKENIEIVKQDETISDNVKLNQSKSENFAVDADAVLNINSPDKRTQKVDHESECLESRTAFVQRQPTAESFATNFESSQDTQRSTVSSQASKRSRRSLLATKHSCSKGSISDESDDSEDIQILSNLKKLKHDSNQTESLIDTTVNRECVVELEKMSQDSSISQVMMQKTSKRKVRTLIDSSDEDDFVTSQNSAKSNKWSGSSKASTGTVKTIEGGSEEVIYVNTDNSIDKKIATLKYDIQIKKQQIAELEQSEIYKKKHNLEELKSLTKQWKEGCQHALNDLLPLLRENSGNNIDMAELLNEMQIPYSFIGYNVDENCFI